MTTSPLPDQVPRFAIFRGKKARIIGYEDGKFEILDSRDNRRRVTRLQLKFLPQTEGRKSR